MVNDACQIASELYQVGRGELAFEYGKLQVIPQARMVLNTRRSRLSSEMS